LVVDILTKSFDDNKSVNYIINQDGKRVQKIRRLMEYSYDQCELFGDIFLSDDKTGCALIIKPDMKRTTLRTVAAMEPGWGQKSAFNRKGYDYESCQNKCPLHL
jgi:hypothetical protein